MRLANLVKNLERNHVPDYAEISTTEINGPNGNVINLKFTWGDTQTDAVSTYEICIDFHKKG